MPPRPLLFLCIPGGLYPPPLYVYSAACHAASFSSIIPASNAGNVRPAVYSSPLLRRALFFVFRRMPFDIFLRKISIYLHISKKSITFALELWTLNDGQATVKRQSSDSQSQRAANVAPKISQNLCTILYYIFIYNILSKHCDFFVFSCIYAIFVVSLQRISKYST